MKFREIYMLSCAVIIILFPIFYSTITTQKITATDWIYRHSVWIDRYLKGDFTPILEYPPLFHLIMSPFVYFHFPVVYLQILFAISSLFGVLYLIYKLKGKEALILTAILFATSISFIEFSSALMPQSLDYFLFPLAILAYFNKKYLTALTVISVTFFMHIAGIVFMGILFLHSLATKRHEFTKYSLLLIILFGMISFYYIFADSPLFYIWDFKAQAEWESFYISPIYRMFIFSGILTWILLPFAGYKLIKEKVKFDEKLLLYAIWVLAFIPLGLFNFGIWRMISYQIVPLTLFVASVMCNEK